MKKYIIISGVPRAGKSTISKRIAKEYGYQHISMDSVIAGIEKVFPETRVNTNADVDPVKNLEFISSKIGPFIHEIMRSGEYDECDYGVVIDVYQLLPKDFIEYIGNLRCDIYYFLSSDVTTEERFQILKANDTPKDYTYFHSDEDNRKNCEEIVSISHYLKEQCILYQLPFIETSNHREQVLNEFMEKLV